MAKVAPLHVRGHTRADSLEKEIDAKEVESPPLTTRSDQLFTSFEFEEITAKDSCQPQWDEVSFLSRITYLWILPFLRNGQMWFRELDNIFRIPNNMQSDEKLAIMEQYWEKEKSKPNPKFWKVLARAYWREWLWIVLQFIIVTFLSMGVSLIIGRLIDCINDQCEEWEGFIYAGLLFVIVLSINTIFNYTALLANLLPATMKASTLMLSYKHVLALSQATSGSSDTGKIMGVVSTDIELFELVTPMTLLFPAGPPGLLLSTVILYYVLGVAGLLGVSVLILIFLFNVMMTFNQIKFKLNIGKATDSKMKLLSSIIEGIKVVKMYVWEILYQKMIQNYRNTELKNEAKNSTYLSFFRASNFTAVGIILFITFSTYIALGNELTSSKAFTVVSLVVSALNSSVAGPSIGFVHLITIGTACTRIGNVLLIEKRKQEYAGIDKSCGVVLNQLSASWQRAKISNLDKPQEVEKITEEEEKVQSQEIESEESEESAEDNENSFTPSSSEDSSLYIQAARRSSTMRGQRLSVLAMRLARTSTDMATDTLSFINIEVSKGQLAAVVGPTGSGKSSLLSSILGEMNITQGRITLGGKWAYVEQEPWIRQASLKDNIIMNWPYDQERYEKVVDVCSLTRDLEILTNGDQTMLGGSGANLSGGQIARVSLARAVYSDADIYLLDDPLSAVDAKIRVDLYNRCICDFLRDKTRILVTHQGAVLENVEKIICLNNGMYVVQGSYDQIKNHAEFISIMGRIAKEQKEKEKTAEVEEQKEVKVKEQTVEKDKSKTTEKNTLDAVTFSTYKQYWNAGGFHWFFLIMLFLTAVQVLYLAIPWWVSVWTGAEAQDDFFYAWVLLVLGVALFLCGIIRQQILQGFLLLCNRNIHKKLLSGVLRSPAGFFDANPAGRVLDRFSKDTLIMDQRLKADQSNVITFAFLIAGNAILIMILTPYTVLVIVPLLLFIVCNYIKIMPCVEKVAQNELNSKSPILNIYGSSIKGLTTIRAYGYENWLIDEMKSQVDVNQRCSFTKNWTRRFYIYYTDIACSIFVTVNAIIIYAMKDSYSPETAGLGLSFSASFLAVVARILTDIVAQRNWMNSVQRVMEYCDLETEASLSLDQSFEIKQGKLEFRDVYMKYRPDLDWALKGLSLVIEPGTKVGIVGRSGSGKSTILQVLFRLVEMSQGQLLIDGQDISRIGLPELRQQLSVIPQMPFIFPDTVKRNLDPFEKYSNEQIWAALEAVQLKEFFEQQPDKLDTNLDSGTVGLSIGQRQFIALARAILWNRKILVLDEATANIDLKSDEQVQKTIKSHFSDCTVLSIAHRLDTIIDSDKVIVMDAGKCIEYSSPTSLISNPASLLSQMLDALGEADSAKLRQRLNSNYAKQYLKDVVSKCSSLQDKNLPKKLKIQQFTIQAKSGF